METESGAGGLTYRYVYGLQKAEAVVYGIPNGVGDLAQDYAYPNGPASVVKFYYHQDRLGTTDFLSDNIDGKVTSYVSYDDWGALASKAVLKVGVRELDLVQNYTGHPADMVLGVYYAKARMYDAQDRRFMAKDPIKDGLNWYAYCNNNPIVFIDPDGLEHIVVSGSEYDGGGRYKYNFIEPAIKKLRELVDLNDGENTTWVISKTGYGSGAISTMQELAFYLGVNVVLIDSAVKLQNYINSKDTGTWELSSARTDDKITQFALFSHGYTRSVELGHGQSATKQAALSMDSNWVGGLFSEAFDNPNSEFYSCNTGTGGDNSFAQAWVNVTGGSTWAVANGATWYGSMNDGESNWDKVRRVLVGFNTAGSRHYPVAGNSPADFMNFTGNEES